jgi:malate:Na+ symporter
VKVYTLVVYPPKYQTSTVLEYSSVYLKTVLTGATRYHKYNQETNLSRLNSFIQRVANAPKRMENTHGDARSGKFWWRMMDIRIGIVPLPVYVVLAITLCASAAIGRLPSEMSPMIGLLAFSSFTCYEVGRRIPLFRMIGGPVILATFLPSYLVFSGIFPPVVVKPIVDFWNSTNFIYLYIPCVIVGSIMSMERSVLLAGFARIFLPLAAGSIIAAVVGTAVGTLMGVGWSHTLLFIVVPVMSGGLGEGVIPLTLGYAQILGQPQGEVFAQALPAVLLGNLCAIIFSGLLNTLGKRRPDWTGNGILMRNAVDALGGDRHGSACARAVDIHDISAAGVLGVCLYMVGMLIQYLTGIPGPVAMLVLAVAVKVFRMCSPSLEIGAASVYQFFAVAVTYPLLFAIGVAITPWQKIAASINLATMTTIVVTVGTMMLSGFLIGKRMGMYPIEAAIVTGTHTGMGGTGDVAILSAANRMALLPFAQIATRIGGAITITLTLIILSHVA